MLMLHAERRVGLVVRAVVYQAMHDAGVQVLRLVEEESAASALIARWCDITFQRAEPALTVSAANKTTLLLAGPARRADLYPLGDLYASQVEAFGGIPDLDPATSALAEAAGGIGHLDAALSMLLDERRHADAAFVDLPHIRDSVLARLQKTRFQRSQLGLIPKLGARTIGIDLFI
jgi:hypothetical protein